MEMCNARLEGADAVAALSVTKLDIQVASVGDDEVGFFAAHGRTTSILVLKENGEVSVWCLKGPEKERRGCAAEIRRKIEALHE